VHWDDCSFVIDPWLIGSEIDYFSWFNEQWHTTPPILPSQLGRTDFILISQSYSDHCHKATLSELEGDLPILASPKAYNRLRKSFSKKRLVKLPIMTKGGFLQWGSLRIASIDPGRKMDPVYYAHIIVQNDKAIFYSSHGFDLNEHQKEILSQFDIVLMLTSFSEIWLPKILGGKVNPGMDNAYQLIKTLKPKKVMNTHDEEKKSQGIVMKMATTKYPDLKHLELIGSEFINEQSYEYVEILPEP
jgi:L-ascorbate metabolism protein UlaG (beta-lactamase superfamily)